MKVFIKIQNGLGNQMFQYALGCMIKKKYPCATIIYEQSSLPDRISGRETQDINSIFEHDFQIASDKEIRLYCGNIMYNARLKNYTNKGFAIRLYRFITNKINFLSLAKTLKEPTPFWNIPDCFVDYILQYKLEEDKIYHFKGFWEDVRYLEIIRHDLKNYFRFQCAEKMQEKYNEIISRDNTVMIHVRRGDYLDSSHGREYEYYNICLKEYYRQAMQIMEVKVRNPLYVFFSDDVQYVYSEYTEIKNKIVISGNVDYEDLYLMTQCRNFILANSTFSFWGAYLAQNSEYVIAPKVHYIHMGNKGTVRKEFFHVAEWKYIDNLPKNFKGEKLCK